MDITTQTERDRLAALLRQAADAHHAYEAGLGHADADWPTWYATYMVEHACRHHGVG